MFRKKYVRCFLHLFKSFYLSRKLRIENKVIKCFYLHCLSKLPIVFFFYILSLNLFHSNCAFMLSLGNNAVFYCFWRKSFMISFYLFFCKKCSDWDKFLCNMQMDSIMIIRVKNSPNGWKGVQVTMIND